LRLLLQGVEVFLCRLGHTHSVLVLEAVHGNEGEGIEWSLYVNDTECHLEYGHDGPTQVLGVRRLLEELIVAFPHDFWDVLWYAPLDAVDLIGTESLTLVDQFYEVVTILYGFDYVYLNEVSKL
jgi:hypothetical protein